MINCVTLEEKVYLMSWAVAYSNSEESKLFREKYEKDAPPISTVKYWRTEFRKIGSLDLVTDQQRSGRPRTASNDANRVFCYCTWKSSNISKSYCIAEEMKMSVGSMHNILKQEEFHPFKLVSCQLRYLLTVTLIGECNFVNLWIISWATILPSSGKYIFRTNVFLHCKTD